MTSPEALEIETCLTWIETFFSALPMDVACFREGARIRVGRSTPFMGDAMIAATARVHGLEVASRNQPDFQHLQVKAFNPFRFEL
jgi:predicted nucleic acid-binding protein